MAELLAVAGGISGFLTIAEVASKLVRGCITLIKDAKNAPKDVRKLVRELESLSYIAGNIERIVGDTESAELRKKVDEAVRVALERCVEVVGELRKILDEYENEFQRHGMKLWWEKVKVVKGKKGVATLLEKIGRAKVDLVLAHQNASSIVAQSQSGTLCTISQSVGNIHSAAVETSTKIDNFLDQGKEILVIGKTTEQQTRASETQRQNDFQNGMRQLEAMSDSQDHGFSKISHSLATVQEGIASTSAKLDDTMERTQAVFTVTERTHQGMVGLERGQSDSFQVLQSIERQTGEMSAVMSNPEVLARVFAQALMIRDRGQERDQVENYADAAVQSDNIKPVSSQRSPLVSGRRTRWNNVSYTRYLSNRYLRIESTTWEENPDEESSALGLDSSKATKTCTTFRSKLPFFMRALYYTTTRFVGDPLYERMLRPVMVFSDDSAIWKACENGNVDEVRRLFVSREASPFMEDEYGRSLPGAMIEHAVSDYVGQYNINNLIPLFDLLFQAHGRMGTHIRPRTTFRLLYFVLNHHTDNRELVGSLNHCMRLIIKYSADNPLDDELIAESINYDDIHHPIITTMTQQSTWSFNLKPQGNRFGFVKENERQMLEDPKADYLKGLLESANYYCGFIDGTSRFRSKSCESAPSVSVGPSGLLELASTTTRDDIRECCMNRLKLFISTPKLHRFIETTRWGFDDFITAEPKDCYDDLLDPEIDVCLGRYAIRNGCRLLLEDVFREIGWRDMDIDDFFDKETFYSVPGLLDGQIVYETAQDAKRQFMANLCDGAFTEISPHEVESVAHQMVILILGPDNKQRLYDYECLGCIKDMIEAANVAFLSKNIPGSWPEEEKSRLVPGVDFTISEPKSYCPISIQMSILSWYRDYIDPDFVIDISDEDSYESSLSEEYDSEENSTSEEE